MRMRDFLALVQERLGPLMPPELRPFQARIRFSLLQIYYWRPSIHYEVWPQRKMGRIEVGLHFEGEGEESYRWAAVLAERMPQVQAAASGELELEEWTPTWTRLHRSLPLGDPSTGSGQALDEALAQEVAQSLATLIRTTQPILEECRSQVEEETTALPQRPAPPSLPRGRPRYARLRRRRGLGRGPFP